MHEEAGSNGTAQPAGEKGGASWVAISAVVAAGLSLVVAIFWAAAAAAIETWNTATYQYCYLIIAISLYFVWMRRDTIRRMRPEPSPWGLLLVPFPGLLWLAADAAEVLEGQQFAIVGMVQVLLLSALGWQVFRALLFPILYLWLLVPTGEYLVPSLQVVTTFLTVEGLRLTGIFVVSEGNVIDIPTGRYLVVEACAGLSFLLGALAFSPVYANLMYRGGVKRTAFVVIMLAVAVLANGMRAYGIVVWNHFVQDHIDIGGDHVQWGWAYFAVVFLLAIWLGMRFRDAAPIVGSDSGGAESAGWPKRQVLARVVGVVAVAVMGAAVAPTYAAYAGAKATDPETVTVCLPAGAGPWQGGTAASDWNPVFPGADGFSHRRFTRGGEHIDLFVAYYWRQSADRELVSKANRVADGKAWLWMSSGHEQIRVDGESMVVNVTRLRAGNRRRLVWHWYWVDGRYSASSLLAKLLQAKANLLYGDRRAAFVAVSTEEGSDPARANDRLRVFLESSFSLRSILANVHPRDPSCTRN